MFDNVTVMSSGTTGEPKLYLQPPKKIIAASEVAINVLNLTKKSKVYTCCRLTHAGGLLVTKIPCEIIGCKNDIVKFSAYDFVKNIQKYTHSHITPDHARAIMGTKGFRKLDLTGITIMCGSDRVTWDIIEAFVSKGCRFITNWGMSEIGPVTINHTFDSMEEVYRVKEICPENMTVLGGHKYCEYRVDKTLWVKGELCIYDDWYNTKDVVTEIDNILFYIGRV